MDCGTHSVALAPCKLDKLTCIKRPTELLIGCLFWWSMKLDVSHKQANSALVVSNDLPTTGENLLYFLLKLVASHPPSLEPSALVTSESQLGYGAC